MNFHTLYAISRSWLWVNLCFPISVPQFQVKVAVLLKTVMHYSGVLGEMCGIEMQNINIIISSTCTSELALNVNWVHIWCVE
jgi:hypothetical protein